MFFDMSKYIHYKSLLNALSIEIKLPYKISFKQDKRYKKCTLFYFRQLQVYRFTFNLRFLYELKIRLS